MSYNLAPSSRHRKVQARIALLFALIALALIVLPTTSFAGTDAAGNVLTTEADSTPSGVEGDLYWAGQSLNLDDASIGRDIIAAGESLSIRDCTVGGAVRLAARTIDIAKTAIDGSVTVAGQHVVLNTGSTANCFYAAGETVALRGSAKSAALAGDTVTVDGTVDGDVEVWADKLILGKNARITGTVNAHVSQDPERAEALRSGLSKSTEPKTRTPLRSTTLSAASLPQRFPPALSLSCSSLSFRAQLPVRRHAASASHAAVGKRSSGRDSRRSRRPVAHHLDCRPVARRRLMCGIIGIALVSAAFTGTAIARMVGHNQNRYAMAAVVVSPQVPSRDFPSSATSSAAWPLSLCSATLSRSSGATPTSSPNRTPTRQDSPPPSRQPPQKGQAPLWWCEAT